MEALGARVWPPASCHLSRLLVWVDGVGLTLSTVKLLELGRVSSTKRLVTVWTPMLVTSTSQTS